MTQSCPQRALSVSTRSTSLHKVALLIACLSCLLSAIVSAGDNASAGLLTEEYTVWPKETAEPLPNGYPWKSCNRTTGADCPGLSDYIHHFCVDYGNAGCPRKNRILAEKRVILNLLPGEHKITFRRCFLWFGLGGNVETEPQCHLFCNVSELSIRGEHVPQAETSILAVRMEVPKRLKSDGESNHPHANPCDWNCGVRLKHAAADWSAFAFRGGGNVTFQDITFRSESLFPRVPEENGQNFISAWDLGRFKVQRCHFPELRNWMGALALLSSKNVMGVPYLTEMIVKDCTFGFSIEARGSSFRSCPAIAILPMELCKERNPIHLIGTHGKPSVKLHQCTFQLYFAEDARRCKMG